MLQLGVEDWPPVVGRKLSETSTLSRLGVFMKNRQKKENKPRPNFSF